jgi:hypothetical protein
MKPEVVASVTQLIETLTWFMLGLTGITTIGLATWIAMREIEIPRVGKWSLVVGVLAISILFMESVAWLLLALTMIATVTLPARIALRDRPKWIKWTATLGAISLVVALLVTSSPHLVGPVGWAIEQGSRNGPLLLLVSLLVVLSLLGTIWLARPSTDRRIRNSYLYGALLWTGLSFLPTSYFFGMVTFERAISSAWAGEIEPGAIGHLSSEVEWNREVRSWMRDHPQLSDVRCHQRLFPDGACCLVDYPDGRHSEIHIFRTGFRRYTVRKLTVPTYGLCRNPEFDPHADPGSPEGQEFIPCERSLTSVSRCTVAAGDHPS